MSLVVESRTAFAPGQRPGAKARAATEAEYAFLLERHVSEATLAQACALADAWGVHPHEVLIAQGSLAEDTYYRALAETAGRPFKAQVAPHEATLPAKANPRQCLAHGLLKERTRAGGYVLAASSCAATCSPCRRAC